MGKIIGIDLGTTNSAGRKKGKWRESSDPQSNDYLTPYLSHGPGQHCVCQQDRKKERLVTHPADTASVFKRFMGTEKIYSLAGKNITEELSTFVLEGERSGALQEKRSREAIISAGLFRSCEKCNKKCRRTGRISCGTYYQ